MQSPGSTTRVSVETRVVLVPPPRQDHAARARLADQHAPVAGDLRPGHDRHTVGRATRVGHLGADQHVEVGVTGRHRPVDRRAAGDRALHRQDGVPQQRVQRAAVRGDPRQRVRDHREVRAGAGALLAQLAVGVAVGHPGRGQLRAGDTDQHPSLHPRPRTVQVGQVDLRPDLGGESTDRLGEGGTLAVVVEGDRLSRHRPARRSPPGRGRSCSPGRPRVRSRASP